MKKILVSLLLFLIFPPGLSAGEIGLTARGEIKGTPYFGIGFPLYSFKGHSFKGTFRGDINFSRGKWEEEYKYPPPFDRSEGKITMIGFRGTCIFFNLQKGGEKKWYKLFLSKIRPYGSGEINCYDTETTWWKEKILEIALYGGIEIRIFSFSLQGLFQPLWMNVYLLTEGGYQWYFLSGDKERGFTYNVGGKIGIRF